VQFQAIYNVDGSALTTVQRPGKITECKGEKQVDEVASAEWRTLVTLCVAVSGLGNSIPPFLECPRDGMRNRAPPGTNVVCHVGGWMTREKILQFLSNLKYVYVTCSPQMKMDNHDSHVTPAVFISRTMKLPYSFSHIPATSCKPLDQTVFGQ
jgi:hypothetical protein